MEKQKKIPKLRFPEFEGEWSSRTLKDIVFSVEFGVSVNSIDEPVVSSSDRGILKTSCVSAGRFIPEENKTIVIEEIQRAKLNPEKDTIIVSRMNTPQLVGESGYVDKDYNNLFIPDRLWKVKINKEKHLTKLISILLTTDRIKSILSNIATGTSNSMKNISQPNFLKIALYTPSLQEQKKIASFFTAIDQKISQLKSKKTLLEQYKKGVMQKIFSQEIRFKDDNGQEFPKWEKKKLSEISDRRTAKNNEGNENVLTISAQYGLVSQLDFFNKSVAANDLSGYYLLRKDDFVYNRSYSAGYPMGAFKRLKLYDRGVVSTLYICFTFNSDTNLSFIEQYFESGRHNREIERIAQEGARNHGLLNIGVGDFFNTEILLPSLPEQTKIANFLSAIDVKINHTQKQIEKAEVWKKGLMQQMFV
jgi:type I restriction enzyme S subunit